MVHYQETSDANFFALVHHVLESRHAVSDAGRPREHHRHEFLCHQFIAPYVGGVLPKQTDFRRVLCHDLSPSGFSYLESTPPECDFLIVALGSAPYIFVSAQALHHEPIEVDGQTMYLMGCRFVARIKGVLYGHRLGESES
jgi:hypothetical protein